MHCPNCNDFFVEELLNRQKVLHCKNCGCSFFEVNGINKITERTAIKLANDRKSDYIFGEKKHCPVDQAGMSLLRDRELTREADLFRCEKCRGIFVYPEDLLQFKKSQNIILEYFRLLHRRLPSPAFAFVLTLLIVLTAAMATSQLYRSNHATTTQAHEVITTMTAYYKDSTFSIEFQTRVYVKSKVRITDTATRISQTVDIATFPSRQHQLKKEIKLTGPVMKYQLVLINLDGSEMKTPEYTLPTK